MIDRETALELRSDGMTYTEVASVLGVTMGEVYIAAGHVGRTRTYRAFTPKRCVYPNIRDWLNNNKITLRQLCEYMCPFVTGATINRIRDMLSGATELRKSDIDRLLKLTGLTYEQAFLEVEI